MVTAIPPKPQVAHVAPGVTVVASRDGLQITGTRLDGKVVTITLDRGAAEALVQLWHEATEDAEPEDCRRKRCSYASGGGEG